LLTGRKLLLADDSAAIQKVIDLTFSDEGMSVTTVGDGRSALAELEQYPPPDVILADVFMPELGGYELCRQIKQNERFSQIPVILLVSSFEPFDEAEAQRAGADDFVTKPFQSIRQLVNRVGTLLGGKQAGSETAADASFLEAEETHPQLSEAIDQHTTDSNVTVLLEAPMMETHESSVEQGPACSTDVQMQTADTQRLERVTDEAVQQATTDEWRYEDTMEVPVAAADEVASVTEVAPDEAALPVVADEVNEQMRQETYQVRVTDDALLDLEDEVISQEPLTDDVFLDLDLEEPTLSMSPETMPQAEEPAVVHHIQAEYPIETVDDEPVVESQSWAMTSVNDPVENVVTELVAESQPWPVSPTASIQSAADAPDETVSTEAMTNLSPQQIDAIAKKVVERLSDKVVREIAWEVVPELAELLIKKRLDEPK
jgi:CheY-like chemotaxis protein